MNKQYYVEMVSEFRQKVAEVPSNDNRYKLASSIGGLGNYIAEEEGDFQEAIRLHQEARAIYSSLSERDGEARSCFNLGAIYHVGLKQYDQAKKYLREGLILTSDQNQIERYEPRLIELEDLTGEVSFIVKDCYFPGVEIDLKIGQILTITPTEHPIGYPMSYEIEFNSKIETLLKSARVELKTERYGENMVIVKGLDGKCLIVKTKIRDDPNRLYEVIGFM